MTTSNIDSFVTGCSELFVTRGIIPIYEYLTKVKKYDNITLEELLAVQKLPIIIDNMVSANTIGTRKRVPVSETCDYIKKRGPSGGDPCGKPATAGNRRCRSHFTVDVDHEKNINKSNMDEFTVANTILGLHGVPNFAATSAPEPDVGTKVVIYDAERKLYKEPVNKFLIWDNGKEWVCIGKLNQDTSDVFNLNDEEKEIARSLNFVVPDAELFKDNSNNAASSSVVEQEIIEDTLIGVVHTAEQPERTKSNKGKSKGKNADADIPSKPAKGKKSVIDEDADVASSKTTARSKKSTTKKQPSIADEVDCTSLIPMAIPLSNTASSAAIPPASIPKMVGKPSSRGKAALPKGLAK